MRLTIKPAQLLGTALIALSGAATAASDAEKYFGLTLSFVDPDVARFTTDEGVGVDFLYGHSLPWKNVFVELRGSAEVHETGVNGGSDNYRGAGSIELQYLIGQRGLFSAFILGGGGFAYNDNRTRDYDEGVFFANAGGGLLSRNLTSADLRIRIEARGRYESYGPGMSDYRVGVGLEFPLDNKETVIREVPVAQPAAPAAPAPEGYPPRPVDVDQDGVLDNFDKCPGTVAGAMVDAAGCQVTFQKPDLSLRGVEFEPNSDELTAGARTILESVAKTLASSEAREVTVAGHTDSQGAEDFNLGLSLARANSVKRFLTQRGVAASRLKVVGFGESQPVASNDTVEGRARNRRVEIRLEAAFDPK